MKFDLDITPLFSEINCGNQNWDASQTIMQAQRSVHVWIDELPERLISGCRIRRYVTI
jgi:hypothetical protein